MHDMEDNVTLGPGAQLLTHQQRGHTDATSDTKLNVNATGDLL